MSMSVSLTSHQPPVAPVPRVVRQDSSDSQAETQTQVDSSKASMAAWKTTGANLDIRV